jgi:small subunit ribosomal protein S15
MRGTVEQEQKATIVSEYQTHPTDTGSADVQIAILTHRIRELTPHFQTHRKDHHSRRGLLKMVGRRRRLLTYMARTNPAGYSAILVRLGLNR